MSSGAPTLGGLNRLQNPRFKNVTVTGDVAIGDDLAVTGDAVITGTLTAASIIGSVSENAGFVATADDGTTQTLTAGMVTGSPVFTVHVTTGGTTPSLTMPLATAIIAANTGWTVGDAYVLRVINTNSGTATLVTNTGITTSGTLTIPTGGQADFIIAMSGAATVTMTRVNQIPVTLDAAQALTNKTLTTPVIASVVNSAGGTFIVPTASAGGTLVGIDTTDTLTNKTLTSPVVNGATIGSAAGTVVTIVDGGDIAIASGTGTKIGSAAGSKIGFWGVTPVVQQSLTSFAAVATTAVTTAAGIYGFTTAAQGDGIVSLLNQIRAILIAEGHAVGP